MGAKVNYETRLASAVANNGTVVVPAYPAGFVQADLLGSIGGEVVIDDNDRYLQATSGVRVTYTFGASTITITNVTGQTWPAGAKLIASFGRVDRNGSYNLIIGTTKGTAADGGGGNPNYTAAP